jgi:hypothetical protein
MVRYFQSRRVVRLVGQSGVRAIRRVLSSRRHLVDLRRFDLRVLPDGFPGPAAKRLEKGLGF